MQPKETLDILSLDILSSHPIYYIFAHTLTLCML